MDYITVGEIVKAQGIRGEVKVRSLAASPDRFSKLRVLYIDEKPFRLLGVRGEGEYVYIKLQGIDDRNAAERLCGKFLRIDRINAVDLDDGEYFIADILGCTVVTTAGDTVGKITDVAQNAGTADVITVAMSNGKEMRFPFLNRVVEKVDIDAKTFTVIAEKLQEVCVYDD